MTRRVKSDREVALEVIEENRRLRELLNREANDEMCHDKDCPLWGKGIWGHPIHVHERWGL
jgi:hypothetical protein